MPCVSIELSYQKADEFRQIVEKNSIAILNNRDVALTVSGGVSAFMNKGDTLDELIKQADMAMYEAKNSGRNTIVKSA